MNLRKLILARDPLCRLEYVGCTQVSTLADHALPKAAGGDDSMDNLQGVCATCHGVKTRTVDPGLIAAYRKGRPGTHAEGDRGSLFRKGLGPQTVQHRQTHSREIEKIVKLPQVQ